MTVVDRFSKAVILVALGSTTAPDVARAFFDAVVFKHGMPLTITSDRDARFTGDFWTSIMKELRTSLQFSTAYHPQTDGMAEVTNRTMEQLLRLHCKDATWVQWLPYVEFVINTTPQSRTGLSPYEVVYGRKALFPVDVAVQPANVPAAQLFVRDLKATWEKIRATLLRVQESDKRRADRARREAQVHVGDRVLLSTTNLRLKSQSDKLRPRYIGPFRVLSQVGKNAFKLDLPDHY